MLIEHRAEGKSFASFAAMIGVTVVTLDGWANKHPEFKEAKEIAKEAAMARWEEIALGQSDGTVKGNATALMFIMKNQFSDDYKDKQEVEYSGDVVFQIDTGIKRDVSLLEEQDYIEADYSPVESDEDLL